MAKAVLGHRMNIDDHLMIEAAQLRQRVRDLTGLIDRLQRENDALRAEILLSDVRHPAAQRVGAPTIG